MNFPRSLNVFASAVALFCIHWGVYADEELLSAARNFFEPLPKAMPNIENDSQLIIALGQDLFFETALSANNEQSCNSCHNLDKTGSGADETATSIGALGKTGTRNSPTVWNAGLQFALFWDARAATLEEQARGPLLNPQEMALPSENAALEQLENEGYQARFELAFANTPTPFNFDNLLFALAAFQRTLISKDRFDEFLLGDMEALADIEKRGLQRFMELGCNGCHNGPLLGGDSLMKLGIAKPYPNQEDKGRAMVTGKGIDNFRFKVPTLRNIGQTAPYFHDGRGLTLKSAVFYAARFQLGVDLAAKDVDAITAFLRSLDNQKDLLLPQ
ncbi:MAG: cytochrome-c peroxidase [Pseudohongiellaceae bacterium]